MPDGGYSPERERNLYAPTGSNSRLIEWLVFTDRDKNREIARLTVDHMRSLIKKDPDHYPMMLGYPKFEYQRLPQRRTPRINWQ
jgi:hypothetical protein